MNFIDKLYTAGKDFAAVTGSSNAFAGKVLGALVGVAAEDLNNMLMALSQPSLCFIPIRCESLTMRRTVDIGTTMLIGQVDQKKDYVTDNSAPRPRTWNGSGYISSLVAYAENNLVIKPSLQVQMAVLDAAADSRQPVKFKTDTGEVVDVLVQDLQITSTAKGAGVKQVTFAVQEVKILNNSVLFDAGQALNGAAAKSIPLRALTNLGKNSAALTGTVDAVGGLLKIHF